MCKKYQTTNCTCSIIFSADAPLGAVKVKIPRDEFIGIFQGVQVEQALNAIEDAKQNKLDKELKKPADEPKAPEKAQQELKLAQELKEIEDTKAKAQQELKEIEAAKAKAQQELKLAQESQAKEDAISEAKAKVQQELKLAQEAEARAAALEKLKQEEYEKEKQSAAAKARVLEEIKAEAYAKEKAILEAKAKAQSDLKAEAIAKKKAEEQAKAQAVIDEKNRVAAAKAAEAQEKKNREQEIAEERRKIAESQKKIEELKNKPLDNKNSKLDKPLPNAEIEKKQNSKSVKAQDEVQIEFPYFAVIRCYPGMQPEIRHMMLSPCFAGGGNNSFETNLEINNGSDYGLFTGHAVENQIARLGTVSQEGVRILLRKNFKISAQNAHDYFVLNITIYDAKTNNIIEQKSASLYGYIGFRN